MTRSNCVVFACQQWWKHGGYLVIGRSQLGWWPHIGWMDRRLTKVQFFQPSRAWLMWARTHRRWCPPWWFAGRAITYRRKG